MKRRALLHCLLFGVLAWAGARAQTSPDDEARFQQAIELFNRHEYGASESLLKDLVERHPRQGLYWFNLGIVHSARKDARAAESCFLKVIELNSPLEVGARLYGARLYRQEQAPLKAAEILTPIAKRALTPHSARLLEAELLAIDLDLLKKGVALFREGSDEAALAYFDRMLAVRPIAEAYQMRGMLLLRMGDAAAATEAFRKVAAATQDSTLRQDAYDFLSHIYDRKWGIGTTSWLMADLAGGFNSNLFSEGNAVVGRAQTELTLYGGYHFQQRQPLSLRLAYNGVWDEYDSQPALRYITQTLQAPVLLRIHNLQLGLGPTVTYEVQGNSAFAGKAGAQLTLQQRLGSWELSASLEYDRSFPLGIGGSYLAGDNYFLRLYATYLGSSFIVMPSYSVSVERVGDLPITGGVLPLGNKANGPSLLFSWFPHAKWQLKTTINYQYQQYLHPARPTGTERLDDQLEALIKVWYNLDPSFRIFGSLDLLFNRSSLRGPKEPADKNFTQSILLFGFSWSLLS